MASCAFCGEATPRKANKYCGRACMGKASATRRVAEVLAGARPYGKGSTSRSLRRWLIQQRGEKCEQCGWAERNPITGKVPIELNHKDGNSDNDALCNLELLCPNHHSLTPNFRALNKGNGRTFRRTPV